VEAEIYDVLDRDIVGKGKKQDVEDLHGYDIDQHKEKIIYFIKCSLLSGGSIIRQPP
jgi:hypothetical protein